MTRNQIGGRKPTVARAPAALRALGGPPTVYTAFSALPKNFLRKEFYLRVTARHHEAWRQRRLPVVSGWRRRVTSTRPLGGMRSR
jgi:hypothetical protein